MSVLVVPEDAAGKELGRDVVLLMVAVGAMTDVVLLATVGAMTVEVLLTPVVTVGAMTDVVLLMVTVGVMTDVVVLVETVGALSEVIVVGGKVRGGRLVQRTSLKPKAPNDAVSKVPENEIKWGRLPSSSGSN